MKNGGKNKSAAFIILVSVQYIHKTFHSKPVWTIFISDLFSIISLFPYNENEWWPWLSGKYIFFFLSLNYLFCLSPHLLSLYGKKHLRHDDKLIYFPWMKESHTGLERHKDEYGRIFTSMWTILLGAGDISLILWKSNFFGNQWEWILYALHLAKVQNAYVTTGLSMTD